MSDSRAAMARAAHDAAQDSLETAARYRETRDGLVRVLRAESWTYARLARAVGCSPELIAHILKRK